MLVGDFTAKSACKDIILEYKSSQLQKISDERIPYHVTYKLEIKRKYMTMREYYAHQLQTRSIEGMTIIKSWRIHHQYIYLFINSLAIIRLFGLGLARNLKIRDYLIINSELNFYYK